MEKLAFIFTCMAWSLIKVLSSIDALQELEVFVVLFET